MTACFFCKNKKHLGKQRVLGEYILYSYTVRYQNGIIAIVADNISYNTGTDIGCFCGGKKKNGFYFRKFSIGMRDGFFKLKISRISQTSKNELCVHFFTQ